MASGHSLRRSFGFAWAGLADGAVRDRNLRIHLGLGVLAGAFAARAPLGAGERGLLVLCIALVVAAEAANSAIEAVVDLASPGLHERARVAKDAAAAAVLALAAGSVLVFLAVASGWRGLAATLRLAGALGPPGVGALGAALAAGILPSPAVQTRAASGVLGTAAVLGLLVVARGAESQAGTAAAALCVAIGLGGAAHRRRHAHEAAAAAAAAAARDAALPPRAEAPVPAPVAPPAGPDAAPPRDARPDAR